MMNTIAETTTMMIVCPIKLGLLPEEEVLLVIDALGS
jgi:hypothetical protein